MLATLLLTEKHWLLTGDEVHHPSLAGSRQTQAVVPQLLAVELVAVGLAGQLGRAGQTSLAHFCLFPQQSKDLGFQSTLNSLNLCTTTKYSQDVRIYLLRS